MTFFSVFFGSIGVMAAIFGSSYAVVTLWTAASESAERKRKDAKRALELLERIEANTVPRSEPSIPSRP